MKLDTLSNADFLRLRIAGLRSRLRYSQDKTLIQTELNVYLLVGRAFPETDLDTFVTQADVEVFVLGELSKKYTMEAILQGCAAVAGGLDKLEAGS